MEEHAGTTRDDGGVHLTTPSVARRNEVSDEQIQGILPSSPTKKQLEETSQKRRALFSTSLNSQQRISPTVLCDASLSPNNNVTSPNNKGCERSQLPPPQREDSLVPLTHSFSSDRECDEGDDARDDDVGGEVEPQSEEETPEERIAREQSESLALARQLMAEEAMASYAMSAQYLRDNADNFSSEDLEALQMAMREEDSSEEFVEGDSEESAELSYETMLRLGERLGDVKQERWEMKAHEHIEQLPQISFRQTSVEGKDENDSSVKCLVCQCMYENGDSLRVLPCKHAFHSDCVDQWLSSKDVCPYCRQCIVASG